MEIVVYVAHVDDELIGAGGTILKWAKEHTIRIVYASNGIVVHGRPGHDYRNTAREIGHLLGARSVDFLNIPTMEFDKYGQLELNKRFLQLDIPYDLIITHHPNDVNKDHRIVHESASVLSRYNSSKLLCCDSLGFGVDFVPNFFVDITETIDLKHEILNLIKEEIREYPHERSHKALRARASHWGSKANFHFAEAFECKKWTA